MGKKLFKFFVISQLAHSFVLGSAEYLLQAEKQDLESYLDVLRYLSIRKDRKTLLKLVFIHCEGLNETENLTLNSTLRIHMEGFLKFFHNDKNG